MLEQPVPEARHAPFYDWMGVVTCSVSEATDGRPSKPSVDKERAGVSSQTIVMTFHWRVIRGRHRRDKVRRRNSALVNPILPRFFYHPKSDLLLLCPLIYDIADEMIQ